MPGSSHARVLWRSGRRSKPQSVCEWFGEGSFYGRALCVTPECETTKQVAIQCRAGRSTCEVLRLVVGMFKPAAVLRHRPATARGKRGSGKHAAVAVLAGGEAVFGVVVKRRCAVRRENEVVAKEAAV